MDLSSWDGGNYIQLKIRQQNQLQDFLHPQYLQQICFLQRLWQLASGWDITQHDQNDSGASKGCNLVKKKWVLDRYPKVRCTLCESFMAPRQIEVGLETNYSFMLG